MYRFREEELTLLPAPDPVAPGSTVRCYGQTCLVASYDADAATYHLQSYRELSQAPGFVVLMHDYSAVPAHHVAIWRSE